MLDKKVKPDNLIYRHKHPTAYVKFDKFDNALNLLDKIRKGEISLVDAKNDQRGFKSSLGEIKEANKRYKWKEQKDKLYIIDMLYKARRDVIKFFDDYSSMVSEAKHEATKGIGLKILTP